MIEIAFIVACLTIVLFLSYLGSQFSSEYPYLKVMLFGFGILVLLIMTGFFTTYEQCEYKLNTTNETYIYGDNYSSYHYDDYGLSPSPSENTLNLFHKDTQYNYGLYCSNTWVNNVKILYKTYNWFLWIILGGIIISPFVWLTRIKIKQFLQK